jgi:hypothetical protein
VLLIDAISFSVKMTAVIAAAWFAVKHVGGMHTLVSTLSASGLTAQLLNVLPVLPATGYRSGVHPPIAVQWWAVGIGMNREAVATSPQECWLEIRTAGAGSFSISSLPGPWPWVLSVFVPIVYPELADIQKAFRPSLCSGRLLIRRCKFLPARFIGLGSAVSFTRTLRPF